MQHPTRDAQGVAPKLTVGVLYGFRALMVLIVCHYHIWQQSWLPQYFTVLGISLELDFLARAGYLFVDGMLLMSGFLLYLPYAREKTEGVSVPGLGKYYFNRFTRIVPSYLLAVLVAFFFIAIPQGKYATSGLMAKDLLSHLTFTFNFWKETCLYTPLNGALWTVAVEVQFYLIFPFLARATQKKPTLTLGLMALLGIAYRALVYTQAQDTALLINQMPSFLDVYALGMLGAILYVRYDKKFCKETVKSALQKGLPWLAAAVFALSLWAIVRLLKAQASVTGFEAIRLSQLALRLPFALAMLWAMLSAAVMPRYLQKLLDNRLLRFLSTISFNLYIWHQLLSVQIRQAFFPDTLHDVRSEQWAYTLLCFSVSILAAMLATYGFEQPCAKLAQNLRLHRRKTDRERSETYQA